MWCEPKLCASEIKIIFLIVSVDFTFRMRAREYDELRLIRPMDE